MTRPRYTLPPGAGERWLAYQETVESVAELVGCTPQTARKLLHRAVGKRTKPRNPGRRPEIERLSRAGVPQIGIACQLKCSRQYVSQVVRGMQELTQPMERRLSREQ